MSPKSKVGVIDYGGGNIRSLIQALEKLGTSPELVTSPEQLGPLSHLFFPGQGAFGDCMKKLRGLGLVEPIFEWIQQDKPFFGICVGYQLLFEDSEESPESKGLSVLEGNVVRFREEGIKVPHMGWNSAQLQDPNLEPWMGLGLNPYFYFVHSYHPDPKDSSICAAMTNYGASFPSAVQRGRLIATQFHPEKSQKAGMNLIENFLRQK
ncbi:MAG: imidazole glycerol phosphate synthase subunit HisH [Verrucomicrobia bacterium]|nr:MAG: imidazole glycerol phosphate synthase subunit HisH [Verrucomicrobiota bacterium]RPF85510.1 MAG: imidazole glycerol phosphate synthase subunit HisH [Roseibacillus sp. TMED18]